MVFIRSVGVQALATPFAVFIHESIRVIFQLEKFLHLLIFLFNYQMFIYYMLGIEALTIQHKTKTHSCWDGAYILVREMVINK